MIAEFSTTQYSPLHANIDTHKPPKITKAGTHTVVSCSNFLHSYITILVRSELLVGAVVQSNFSQLIVIVKLLPRRSQNLYDQPHPKKDLKKHGQDQETETNRIGDESIGAEEALAKRRHLVDLPLRRVRLIVVQRRHPAPEGVARLRGHRKAQNLQPEERERCKTKTLGTPMQHPQSKSIFYMFRGKWSLINFRF